MLPKGPAPPGHPLRYRGTVAFPTAKYFSDFDLALIRSRSGATRRIFEAMPEITARLQSLTHSNSEGT